MEITKTNLKNKFCLAAGFILAVTAVNGCKSDQEEPERAYSSIVEIVTDDPNYSFLEAAVVKAGLTGALSGDGPFTVFAPRNEAFVEAGFANEAAVSAAPAAVLDSILKYHVLASNVPSSAIPTAANTETETLAGTDVYITKNAAGVFVNGASVVKADVLATNGTIHVIDKVLTPPKGTLVETAIATPSLSYLVAAVLRASEGTTNVAQVLSGAGPFTVFAPTNDAFIAAGFTTISSIQAADPDVLAGILTYHVLQGRVLSSDLTEGATPATVGGGTLTVTLSGGAKVKGAGNSTPATIALADVIATNGAVHVIDQVLLP